MSAVIGNYRRFGKAEKRVASDVERRVLAIAKSTGAIRPRDLDQHDIARKYLNLLGTYGDSSLILDSK
jgi:hypothetical protein